MYYMMPCTKKPIRRLLFLAGILTCLIVESLHAKPRLDTPGANLAIDDGVPFALVKEIALQKSEQKWGTGALGNSIPLCDLNGNIKAYMFSYRIGANVFPTYDQILSKVRMGRALRGHLQRSERKAAEDLYHRMNPGSAANAVSHSTTGAEMNAAYGNQPADVVARKASRAASREMQRYADKTSIGADEYGTIVVSAKYSMAPVIAYLHYLAPYYYNFDLALEKAEQTMGPGTHLDKIYFLGLSGQFFKFVHGSDSILLNAKSLKIRDEIELAAAHRTGAQAEKHPGKRQMLKDETRKKWDKLQSEAGGG
jgi:hypothetical protein